MGCPQVLCHYDEITYLEFLEHLLTNEPLVLSSQWTEKWWARQSLVRHAGDLELYGSPNYAALRRYGDMVVPVAYTAEREYSEFKRTEMALNDVLDLWEQGRKEGGTLYVKDWQLSKELVKCGLEDLQTAYEVPEIFQDDWMTPRLRDTSTDDPDDFRFTYMGPAGTYTPLHADVYNSYSWSTNLCGRKKWWLFKPGTQPHDGFDVRDAARETRENAIEVIQMPGETIFVPSGWWHQVVNLDFCISVNQNWFNSITLPSVYEHLRRNQLRVEESIEDVKELLQRQHGSTEGGEYPKWQLEWVQAVQELLERDAGWSWTGFWTCVADNLENPPAPGSLSPPEALTHDIVRKLVAAFVDTPEYRLVSGMEDILLRVSRRL